MLMPQVGEHVAHGACHVVAILFVFVDGLNADAVGIEQHKLPHADCHFGHPLLHHGACVRRQQGKVGEDEVGIVREREMRFVADEWFDPNKETLQRALILKGCQEVVEQRRLHLRIHGGRVFHGVRNATQEICVEDRLTQGSWQHLDAQRKGAGHGRQDGGTEAGGITLGERGGDSRRQGHAVEDTVSRGGASAQIHHGTCRGHPTGVRLQR